jgi:2-oxoglutarate ferredoxin oxidoreductase subunit beta
MHDGSVVRFRAVGEDYDPTNRDAAYAHIRRLQSQGDVVTGLLFIDGNAADMHSVNGTIDEPLTRLPYEQLCPGSAALQALQEEYR